MIAIVGAGLAGLACALALHRRGREFLVLEASDSVGGRQKTTRTGGFTLDHGFQVVLDSYQSVREVADVPSLRPKRFESGALVFPGGRQSYLCSPFENPAAACFSPALPLADKLRLALLGVETLSTPDARLLSRCAGTADTTVLEFLARRGFNTESIDCFFRPFFGGVLLDEELCSSAGLFLYYLKKFATGHAWLPERGIQALPESIASQLPPGSVRTGARVAALSGKTITLDTGETITPEKTVLAVDEPSLCRLLGVEPPAPARSVAVVYFKSRESLYPHRCIALPPGRGRTVRHFVQLTNIAPSFAPSGWRLVSATILGGSVSDAAARAAAEIAEFFPSAARCLEHLETIHVPYAVPAQPPGFAAKEPPALPPDVHACGDWRNGASIESAIRSGLDLAKDL
jgi:phytoene dehydrogenase-like protein